MSTETVSPTKIRILRESYGHDAYDRPHRVPYKSIGEVVLVEDLPAPQGRTLHVAFGKGDEAVILVLDEGDWNRWVYEVVENPTEVSR